MIAAIEIAAMLHNQPTPVIEEDEPAQAIELGRTRRWIRGRDRHDLRPACLTQRAARHHLPPVEHAAGHLEPQPEGEIPQA